MHYTIKEASRRTGLTPRALRHYEEIGLMRPSARSDGGYRLYSEADLETLKRIRYYRDLRFPLTDIRRLIEADPADLSREIEKQLRKIQTTILQYEHISQHLLNQCPPVTKSALIILDMQNDFVYGSIHSPMAVGLIAPIQKLSERARKAEIPVVYLCDRHVAGVDRELQVWPPHCLENTLGAEVIRELTPQEGDWIVYKNQFSGFYCTTLNSLLREAGVGRLIVTGLHTHMCVAETVIDALHSGYEVVVPTECVAAQSQADHAFGLKLMVEGYGVKILDAAETEALFSLC